MRPLALMLVTAALLPASGAAAWSVTRTGSGAARAKSVGAGNAPTLSAQGKKVTVTWTASSYSGGGAISSYTVKRYNAVSGVGQAAANGCSGTIAALTCTESSVPNGSWQYTVTPVVSNWRGAESAKSAIVVI